LLGLAGLSDFGGVLVERMLERGISEKG